MMIIIKLKKPLIFMG